MMMSKQGLSGPVVRAWTLWVAGALAVTAVIALIFRPSTVPVDTALVDRGPLQAVVSGEGKTRLRERYVISATVGGRLARVDWMENDKVRAGQVLARIDPLPLLSAIAQDEARIGELESQREGVGTLRPKAQTIEQAKALDAAAAADRRSADAKLSQARAELAQAIRDRDRAHDLYHAGSIPLVNLEQADLDVTTHQNEVASASLDAQAAAARAEQAHEAVGEVVAKVSDPDYLVGVYDAQIAATQADLRKLREDESQTVLYSPADGRILKVDQKSAAYVNAGSPVIEIGDPNSLEFVIELLSTDAIHVRPGASMTIDDGSGTWLYKGRVRYVEPAAFTKVSALGVEEQRVNVVGDFVGAHAGFSEAYRVEARIVTWQGRDVLRVPAAALYRCGGDWCAYAVEGGRARERRIRIDHIGDTEAQVLDGLTDGSRVILHPTDKIADGTSVST
jgi:HlyD family secretion protein